MRATGHEPGGGAPHAASGRTWPRRRRVGMAVLVLLAACAVPQARPVDPADPQAPTAGTNAPARLDAPYVVLISFDGFAARYVQQFDPPNLRRLIERGVWAPEGMICSYPTKTFPNHYALVTGLHPEHHGLVANTFWDPRRGALFRISDRAAVEDGTWYRGEPIWVTAERQGMVAASYFWVGSEADVGGVRPSYWRRFDDTVALEKRVDQVLDWLAYPPARRPHLITFYFSDTDHAGHARGPDSPEVARAVVDLDRALARLLNELEKLPYADRVYVMVTADHGMDGFTPATTRYLEDAVSLGGVRALDLGPNGNLWVDGGPARAREVRDRINERLPGVRAFVRADVPERLHYRADPRIGDVVLVMDSAVVVRAARTGRPQRGGYTHGWDPAYRSMRALFVAAGPRLPAGVEIAPFENVEVYAFIARLLGLEPARDLDGDGAVLIRLLASEAGARSRRPHRLRSRRH